jgi:hypothetical protein
MANTANMAIATNLFTSPGEAFAAIKERPSPWFPLLLLLLGYCAVSLLYLNGVDLAWMLDNQMQMSGADISEEQRAQAVEAATSVPRWVYGAIGAVSSCIIIVIIFAITALYYTIVSFVTNNGVKFKQWFALICWCTLPLLLGLLATIVYLLSADIRFVAQQSLNPLSFGNLLSIDPAGKPTLQAVLLSLDPTTLWSLVLSVLGYQALSQKSLVHAALVVLGPLFLIVLIVVAVATL